MIRQLATCMQASTPIRCPHDAASLCQNKEFVSRREIAKAIMLMAGAAAPVREAQPRVILVLEGDAIYGFTAHPAACIGVDRL